MLKSFVSALALAMSVSPFAMAENSKEITVEIEYEGALLVSEDGAREVLQSIKSEARNACASTTSMVSARTIDADCEKSVIKASISKIVATRDAAGLDTVPSFAKRASFAIAALEQR